MTHRLEFSQVHSYSGKASGISIPIRVRSGARTVDVLAYIDTGASDCLFERIVGETLRLDVEAGEPRGFATAAGRVQTFGHSVIIETLDLRIESMVYFFADENVKKNLLGRRGWLDRLRFGLVEHDQVLYLAPYDLDRG